MQETIATQRDPSIQPWNGSWKPSTATNSAWTTSRTSTLRARRSWPPKSSGPRS